MTALSDVGQFFKSLGGKVHAALVKIFGQQALDQVESQIKTIFEDDVLAIFTDAIAAAETLQVGGAAASSADKRAAAFAQIVSDLKSKGISLAESVVNLGIELVVNLLKSKTAAPAPAQG
jgi:Bacteriophage holin of superfamily 6 (Holin_LLH)